MYKQLWPPIGRHSLDYHAALFAFAMSDKTANYHVSLMQFFFLDLFCVCCQYETYKLFTTSSSLIQQKKNKYRKLTKVRIH